MQQVSMVNFIRRIRKSSATTSVSDEPVRGNDTGMDLAGEFRRSQVIAPLSEHDKAARYTGK